MKRGDYTPADSMYPLSGLDLLAPSTMLDVHASPDLSNMLATKGIASKRRGYQQLGSPGTGAADPVVALIDFEISAQVRVLVAVTTKRQYRYDPDADLWVSITQLDQTTQQPIEWTGTQDNPVDWVVARGIEGKFLIITNGLDKPQQWDGSSDTFEDYAANLPDLVTFGTIAQFYDHIFLGNVTTGTTDRQVVAWSSVGTLFDFTSFPGGVPGGDAGSVIVTSAKGDLVKLKNLGDRLIIYSENAISSVTYIGGAFNFSFEEVVSETRICGPQAIVNLGPLHVYLGQENWYIYDGSRNVQAVGDKVRELYKNRLFVEQKGRAYGFLDQARQRVYWGVPTGDGTLSQFVQEYDLINSTANRWTQQDLADEPFCMGPYSRDNSLRWNSPSIHALRWRDADFTWISAASRKGFPVPVIGSGAGKVFLADDTSADDDGQPVAAHWDTPDFTVPIDYQSVHARWIEVEVEMKGVEVDVLYSTDHGSSFVLGSTLALSNDWRWYRIPIDVTGRCCRLRLFNDCPASSFSFRQARLWYKPGGAL